MSSAVVRTIRGRGVAVRGNDIDTDRIIPARFLRCVTFDGLGDHAFEDDRAGWSGPDGGARHPFDREEFQGASILIVGANFGCGSSREHAPQSLKRWGIRGIVGVSYAEIFFGNCVSLGVPCLTLSAEQIERLQATVEAAPQLELELDLDARRVGCGDVELEAGLADGARRAFLSGVWDSTQLLLDEPEEVERVAAGLPYIGRWPL